MSDDTLSDKQARFVDEYLVDLNATQAAIRAGYSGKTARSQGQRLLTNVDIENAIAKAQEERSERAGIDADRVLQELSRIGLSDLRGAFHADGSLKTPDEWDDDLAGSISAVEVVTKLGDINDDGKRMVDHVHKIKLWDKNSALEKLAKHLGMFIDRVEHTGKDGGPIELTDTERAAKLSALLDKARKRADDE